MRPPIRAARTLTRHLPLRPSYTPQTRPFFSWLSAASPSTSSTITPLSASPHPALVQKADRIKAASLCPTSFEKHGGERVRPAFDCPDCGWPTHKNKERWEEGLAEHKEYCERLREVNMDEHDIRSGRKMKEFEDMPAEQPFEAAVSYSSWDTFFYTRQFRSVDSDQSMRHVSKVLTYPITIASVLHQNGPYTHGNGRITAEGRRSMAAIHSILHLPPGSSEQTAPIRPQPPFRIFLLGARAESTLPPSIWEQLTHIFPRTNFNIYFIGPEVGLPLVEAKRRKGYEFTPHDEYGVPAYTLNVSPRLRLTTLKANYEMLHENLGPFDPYSDVFYAFSPGLGFPHQPMNTASSAPPSTSTEGSTEGTDSAADGQAQEPAEPAQPLVQAQTGWRLPLKQILQTKCPLFFTAFSPLDLQRDVAALFGTTPPSSGSESPTVNAPSEFPQHVQLPTRPVPRIEGVTDEFELVLTPGKNEFGSLKWEIAEWDVRVGVKTNWGLWGIRGKKYEVVEGQEE